MHKNIPVAHMVVSDNGDIGNVNFNMSVKEHIPVGGSMNMMKFHEWWRDRAVPKTRKGVKHALHELGYETTNVLLYRNLALSLNDCYWIKPVSADLCWEQVNLFDNNFYDVFGSLTFDTKKHISNQLCNTRFIPATSQGELQKKWCRDNTGATFMVKGNWGSSYQQSINEVFATCINCKQGVSHTAYALTNVEVDNGGKGLGCYSYNYCNRGLEFVSAWELLQTVKLKQNMSLFHVLRDICINKLGFTEEYFNNFMSYEICLDFIISNTDRHMNNIGVLRNPDTLEYISFAPIYDCGNSMFFRSNPVPHAGLLNLTTHSFIKNEVDLLKYVSAPVLDLKKLPDKEILVNLYNLDKEDRMSRVPNLLYAFEQKVRYLEAFYSLGYKDFIKKYKRR